MENNYLDAMRLKTNTQLFLILKDSKEYNSVAIEAVKQVISERNLTESEISNEVSFIDTLHKEKAIKANIPLENIKKIQNFLFPAKGLLQIVSLDKADGYERKVREANLWAKRGCLVYLIIFIILFVIASL